jgi:predicted transcriptional regulator
MKHRPGATDVSTLATELRVLVDQLKRRFREKVNLGDLTLSQMAVLRRLDSDGAATVTSLARAEGMRPQSMGANVAALEAAGLVSGSPAACKEKVKVGRMACDDWLIEAIRKNLSAEEQQELERAVELLKRLVKL